MAKQNTTDELPTLDDFNESSLLDVIENEGEESTEEEEEVEGEEEEEFKNPLDKKIPEEEEEKEEEKEEEEEEEEEDNKPEAKKEKPKGKKEKEEEEEGEETFWGDVEKITGVEVEVDYGDTNPESPEGAALREVELVKQTEESIWKYIEQNYPRSFKALTVEANGGDLNELITPDYVDFSKMTIEEENVAQQKKILLDYYMEVKKLPEKKAIRMVEADEDTEENGLFIAAKEALEERKEEQITREDELVKKNEKEAQKKEKEDQQMLGYIKNITDKGEIGNFDLPKGDREKFYQFFAGQVNRGPQGGYIFSSPITNENFNDLLEQAYFAFKGGKIDKLVQRRQETKKTRTLKRNAQNEKVKSTTSNEEKRAVKKLPLMDDFATV